MPPIMAFTGPQVESLTKLSRRTLRYWEETGVFRASYVDDRPGRPYRRIYTFRDVVSLRTLALLRRSYRVELDELRRTGSYLSKHYDAPWAEIRFGIAGRHVVFPHPETRQLVSGKPLGQPVIPIDVERIARATETDAAQFRERTSDDIGRITRHRYVVQNAWVIAGTRIPTSAIWHFSEAEYDTAAILKEYPDLTECDVEAALAHERQTRGIAAA